MTFLEVIIIAIGLSMDAFAISITLGLSARKLRIREFLIPGIYFGFFQALMPCIGYFTGIYFAGKIESIDHWIAFLLLGFTGGKMIQESFVHDNEKIRQDSFQFTKMLVLAAATSIDAFAAGITFALFKLNIFTAITITGLTTFFISMGGVKFGNMFGSKYRAKSEFIGGAILLTLGAKILIEHVFFK
jgi:putative Mn2+ efflux pump MntP